MSGLRTFFSEQKLNLQPTRTIPKTIPLNTKLIQQSQVQVGEWCMCFELQVTSAFQHAVGVATEQEGQGVEVVLVGVAHAAAVEDEGVVEEGAVAVGGGGHFVEQAF
jgi:hypothetical protein